MGRRMIPAGFKIEEAPKGFTLDTAPEGFTVDEPSLDVTQQPPMGVDTDINMGVEGLRGLAHGVMGLGGTVGTGLEYLGTRTGIETLQETGKETREYWQKKAEPFEAPKAIQGSILDNPSLMMKGSWWTYNLADMVPSFAAMMVPGVAAGKYVKIAGESLKLTTAVIERLSKIGALTAAGTAGGGMEGASTYQEILQRGGSEEDAAAGMEAMTLVAGALNSIGFGKITGVLGQQKSQALMRFIKNGSWEGLTEYLEEPAEVLIKRGILPEIAFNKEEAVEQLKQGVNVIPIAGLMGGGASAVTGKAVEEPVKDEGLPDGFKIEEPTEPAIPPTDTLKPTETPPTAPVPEKPIPKVVLEQEVAEEIVYPFDITKEWDFPEAKYKYMDMTEKALKYNSVDEFIRRLSPDQKSAMRGNTVSDAEIINFYNNVMEINNRIPDGRFMIDPASGTFIRSEVPKTISDFAHQGDWVRYERQVIKEGKTAQDYDNFVRGTLKDGKINIYFDPDASIKGMTDARRLNAIKVAAKKLLKSKNLSAETPVKVGLKSTVTPGKYLGEYSTAKTLGELVGEKPIPKVGVEEKVAPEAIVKAEKQAWEMTREEFGRVKDFKQARSDLKDYLQPDEQMPRVRYNIKKGTDELVYDPDFSTGKPVKLVGFHGGSFVIDKINKAALGRNTGAASAKQGLFFTNDISTAHDYAQLAKGRPTFGDMSTKVSKKYISFDNPYVYDFKGEAYRETSYNNIISKAIKGGHDGVILKNTYDPMYEKYHTQKRKINVYVVLDDASFLSHEGIVQQALSEGKPVPPSVLKDYPDLKPAARLPRAEGVTVPSEEAGPDLIEEAKKYKTAEEFVGKQGETIYHSTDRGASIEKNGFVVDETQSSTKPIGVWFTREKQKGFGGDVIESVAPDNLYKVSSLDMADLKKRALKEFPDMAGGNAITRYLKDKGYSGIDMDGTVVVFDPAQIKTKAQLTDIWNKAHEKEKAPVPTEEPITEYEIGELNKIDEQITAQASRQAEINVYRKLEKEKAKDEKEVQKMAQQDIADIPVYKAMAEIKGEDVLPLLHEEEAKILKEATKKYKIKPAKGLKKFIREESGQVKVKEIIEVKPGEIIEYAMKEAQKAARVAFRAGDREGIAKAKAKYREALEKKRAREYTKVQTNKMIKDLKGLDTTEMSEPQAKAINDLISDLDLTKLSAKKKLRLTKTREYFKDNPEAELPERILAEMERLDKKPVRDMTLDEFESIYTAVKHHVHLEKRKQTIRVGLEKRRTAQVLSDSIHEMKPEKKVKTEIISSQPNKLRGFLETGRLIKDTFGIRHDHYDLIIETLAGKNSTMDKVLYTGVKEGITKELKYKQDVFKKFHEDIKDLGVRDITKWMNETVTIGKLKLARGERMALYRHSLNADNKRAIIEGGFGLKHRKPSNKIYKMTEAEMSAVVKSLTKAEKSFAEDPVTDLFDNQVEALDKVFIEKNGYPMPREDNYYPKDTMPLARGIDIETESALEQFKGKFLRIGIPKGMLKERHRVQLPIYLNSIAHDINKSVMRSSAYIGLEIPLSNASKLLYDKTFRLNLTNRYGERTWKEIETGLRDIAGEHQTYGTVDELLLKGKNQLSVAILGLNPFVMAKQVLSLPIYLPYVKTRFLVAGVLDTIWHPKEISGRHKIYSPEYLERVEGGYSRDVADVFKTGAEKRLYGGGKTIKERFMSGIKLFDKGAVIPGMHGAVLQVLSEFKAGRLSREVQKALDIKDSEITELTPEQKMELAYKYADYATQRTQPMFSPEHRSSLSKGSAVEKLATMFGSFTNQALNQTRRSYRDAARSGDKQAYAKLGKSLLTIFVINTMGVMAIDDIRDRIYGRKKEGIVTGILSSWAGYMFFVRDLASSVVSKIERGTFLGYDVELPISRIPELLANSIANGTRVFTEKGSKRKKAAINFVDDSLELSTMMMGIPYATPKKLTKAIISEPSQKSTMGTRKIRGHKIGGRKIK